MGVQVAGRSQRPTVFAKALPRVLLVDDDPDVGRVVERMVRTLGCTVVVAESGEAARALVAGAVPDLAIVDLTLPDIDGFSLVEELAAALGDRTPPIIILSGRGDPRPAPAAVIAMLMKPVPMKELVATVKSAIAPTGRSQVRPRAPRK